MARHDDILPRLRDLAEGPPRRLPPERQLAADLGCSRQSLRAALAILETEGRIWRHVGQGTFTGPRPGPAPLRENLLIEAATPEALMHARLLLEPAIAGAAAERATPATCARLSALIGSGRSARDRQAAEAADEAFHAALADAAGNPVLIAVMRFLSRARRRVGWQTRWEAAYRRAGVDAFTGLHSDQHAAVVVAVAAGNGPQAAGAMREHLETIARMMEG